MSQSNLPGSNANAALRSTNWVMKPCGMGCEMTKAPRRQKAYRTPTVALGCCLVGSIDDVADLLAVAERERL
jgi:hypothetical protein